MFNLKAFQGDKSLEGFFYCSLFIESLVYSIEEKTMDTNPTLKTKRLALRRFTLDDVADVTRLAGEKDIASTTLRIPHPFQTEDAVNWINSHQQDFEDGKGIALAVTNRAHGFVIGAIGFMITPEHNHAELGYWIGKPYWKMGYATEAARRIIRYGFETLGLNKIYAHHFLRNPASGKVMQKAGLAYEGTLLKHIKKWDNYEDIAFYGISRMDYNCPLTRAKAKRNLILGIKPAVKPKVNPIKT